MSLWLINLQWNRHKAQNKYEQCDEAEDFAGEAERDALICYWRMAQYEHKYEHACIDESSAPVIACIGKIGYECLQQRDRGCYEAMPFFAEEGIYDMTAIELAYIFENKAWSYEALVRAIGKAKA